MQHRQLENSDDVDKLACWGEVGKVESDAVKLHGLISCT